METVSHAHTHIFEAAAHAGSEKVTILMWSGTTSTFLQNNRLKSLCQEKSQKLYVFCLKCVPFPSSHHFTVFLFVPTSRITQKESHEDHFIN